MAPSILFISPVMPATTGNGLAMRAGTVLRALAERHRVSLLVTSQYPPVGGVAAPVIAERCRQIVVLPSRPPLPETAPRRARSWLAWLRRGGPRESPPTTLASTVFSDAAFDVVHVFRLVALPFAGPWLDGAAGGGPRRHLDLDDVESSTHRRLAELYRLNGDLAAASYEEAEAGRYAAVEAEVLRTLDRVYVCSERDRATLAERAAEQGGAEICVLPNGLPVPAPLPPRSADGRFTLLFVGTLGYYPNTDAVVQLCRRIVPLIRAAVVGRELRVLIVGGGLPASVEELVRGPAIRLIGAVPDLAPWYREADAVVVPIRAGGGTRIKILEAFSHRRPVVSTSLGVEGIAACPEEHVLVGDTPEELARQCGRLLTEPGLADALAERAFDLFSRAHTIEAVTRAIDACS